MFKFLKEKLSNWTKKLTESKQEEEIEEIEISEEKPKKQKPVKQKKEKRPEKEKPVKTEKIKEKVQEKEKSEGFMQGIKDFFKGEPEEKKPEHKKEKPKEEKHEFKEAEKRPEIKGERELGTKIFEGIKEDISEKSIQFPEPEKKKKPEEEKEEYVNLTKEEPKEEKKGFFKRLKEKITHATISDEEFQQYSEDLLMILVENNVAFEVAEKIIQDLKEKILNKEISKKEIEKEIKISLKESIENILIEPFDLIEKIKEKKEPYVILFCGINGSGKTTTIAKFATFLKKEKISCILAAADTFRAASIEQLKIHGERVGVKVIAHDYGSDPAAVGFDAIQYAKKNNIKCVLIDTAGRMHTAKNLLKEMEKIVKVCAPDTKIFIGESITGNDAVEQVTAFNEAIGIDGIILSKADIDEKGGTALSVGYVTKKPILYLGVGQEYKDIEPFNKKKFIEKLGL